jgi:hypothetical protein
MLYIALLLSNTLRGVKKEGILDLKEGKKKKKKQIWSM